MRAPDRISLCSLLVIALAPAMAAAGPVAVEGVVTDAASRWTEDGSRIVTEATVRTTDGREIVVSQLGGSVGGLTMRTFPGPEHLAPGMRVAVAATERRDLSGRMHNILDSVRILYMPPQYVRTGPTKSGLFLYWESGGVFVQPSAEGTSAIAGTGEFAVISASMQTWNEACASCSYMEIIEDPKKEQEVGRDHVNLIKFRDETWCRPATNDDGMRCHSESAAGLTTAVYVDDATSSRDGAIVDADIELNNVHFAISVNGQTEHPGNLCKADLQNTLTHELGHLLGLEHPCVTGQDPPRVDGNGEPVPSCGASGGDPTITEATMYPFQDCGETKKSSLSQDDIDAVCQTYPTSKDPGEKRRVGETSGCCSAGGGGSPAMMLLGMAVFGLITLRRRRTPAPPAR